MRIPSPIGLLALLTLSVAACDAGDPASSDRSDLGADEDCDHPDEGCPDPSHPSVDYISQSPLECSVITFACEDGQTGFSNECGCGCIDESLEDCPDPSDPKVHYLGDSNEDPSFCETILFACEDGQTAFSDACGCGCIDD